ncbi:RES family NAD+ phosphorylase [Allorhodopirellula solitaria]|uniref:RES family NAD+ phosphorylase n=1 Tax=Allorhodopirellula solitaria TaxID=2527987 RepID=UPI0016488074|nr:RES family NAD+ phosphorylase [Allorhodopirellula solitaria]
MIATRVLIVILFSFLSVVGSGSVAVGDLLVAPKTGVAFEGNIYRAPYPGASPTTIDNFNIAASHRYSATGEGALYFSTNSRTVIQELGGSFVGGRTMDTFNVRLDNFLDLSNPAVRSRLGVSLDDLVRTSGDDIYEVTQQLGRFAREQGYNGIIAPSARADGGLNLILFDWLN